MKKILLNTLFISLFLTLSSCGDKKGGRNDLSEKEKTGNSDSKGLVIILEGVFPTNDIYQLFYSNSNTFSEDKSVRVPIYGQTVMQTVAIELPEGVKPQNLRLDYGANIEQTGISIKNVEFLYNDNKFNINHEDFYGKYFRDGQGTSFNPIKLTIELKPNADGNFDPYALSTEELKKSLNKIYNKTKEEK